MTVSVVHFATARQHQKASPGRHGRHVPRTVPRRDGAPTLLPAAPLRQAGAASFEYQRGAAPAAQQDTQPRGRRTQEETRLTQLGRDEDARQETSRQKRTRPVRCILFVNSYEEVECMFLLSIC